MWLGGGEGGGCGERGEGGGEERRGGGERGSASEVSSLMLGSATTKLINKQTKTLVREQHVSVG